MIQNFPNEDLPRFNHHYSLLASGCSFKSDDSSSTDTLATDTLALAQIGTDQTGPYYFETIVLAGPNGSSNNIPRLHSMTGNTRIESQINNTILEFFQITSFNATEEFYYADVSFTAELGQSAVALAISGTYMSAYPSEVEEVLLFSLDDGQQITDAGITLPSILKIDGYFPFLEKYWVTIAKPKFAEATACAELEPYCSMYDIRFRATKTTVILTLNNEECYPHAAAACAPDMEATIPLANVKPYMNAFGLKVLESGYFQEDSPLKRYELARELRTSMPALLFMRVKMPDLSAENDMIRGVGFIYPEASMAVQFDTRNDGLLSGYLDMDALPEDFQSTDAFSISDERRDFTGKFHNNGFQMSRECEVEEGDCTISFTWSDESTDGAIRVAGRWLSCDYGALLFATCSDKEFFRLRNP